MQTSSARRRVLFTVALVLVGCRADTSAPDPDATRNLITDAAAADRQLQRCQVLRNLGQDGFLQTIRYDNRGLVSRWEDGIGTYLPQYDASGRLTRARYVLNDLASATIFYRYQGPRIERETWFLSGTEVVLDELVNTWDARGQLVRRESVPFGVFTTFQYDAMGNAFQVDVRGAGGFLLLSNTYAFTAPIKSPDLTLRGLPYGPQFINYVFNPRRQTAAKAVVSDPQGNLITLFDQDPARSVLVAGQQNFALYQNFFDKLSGTFYAQTWTYQQCPGNNFPPDIPPAPPGSSARRSGAGRPDDLALRGSMSSVRQQIDGLRKRYGK
jgi:YD repeat-containing protein